MASRSSGTSDPGPDDGPVYVDEHHQRFSEFAEDYLDEDEREAFVDHLMERQGYQRISGWGPRSDPPAGDGGQAPEPDPAPAGRGGRPRATGGGKPRYFKR